ncbi:MAG: hypothetical protein KDD52_05765 [Bdellovibrionales bacterium]|nr:hypothetical protein [Bdellovibrionales bacterium]
MNPPKTPILICFGDTFVSDDEVCDRIQWRSGGIYSGYDCVDSHFNASLNIEGNILKLLPAE